METLLQYLNTPPLALTHIHTLAIAVQKETPRNTARVYQDRNMVLCHTHFQLNLLRLLQVTVALPGVLVWCALLYWMLWRVPVKECWVWHAVCWGCTGELCTQGLCTRLKREYNVIEYHVHMHMYTHIHTHACTHTVAVELVLHSVCGPRELLGLLLRPGQSSNQHTSFSVHDIHATLLIPDGVCCCVTAVACCVNYKSPTPATQHGTMYDLHGHCSLCIADYKCAWTCTPTLGVK